MNIIKNFITKNDCYKANVNKADSRYTEFQKNGPKGLMLHSVGCSQPKASVFLGSWNQPGKEVAVHAVIDGLDGNTYQAMPWTFRGWHAGGSANNTHVGVEMGEPACIKYTGGASFTCSDVNAAKEVAERTYRSAVELFAMLCKEYNLNPLEDGVIISHKEGHKRGVASNHGDPEHLWNQLGLGYTMDTFRQAVKAKMDTENNGNQSVTGTQASEFKNLSESDVIAKVGPLAAADMKKTGILASITLAQFILESGYGKSELAQNANNCFGMKKSLSGNTWAGSSWNGQSIYTKETKEQNPDGSYVTITADFRKYPNVETSIADHSAYLLGAKNGEKLRYEGIQKQKDYKKAAQLIKDGGYATSLTYVDNLCSIIERWKLTRFDVASGGDSASDDGSGYPEKLTEGYYRVRKTWEDSKGQLGAYRVLSNAKAKADENPGYFVFDNAGNAFYPTASGSNSDKPDASNNGNTTTIAYGKLNTAMNIRSTPSTGDEPIAAYKKGTIVEILQKLPSGWLRIKTNSGFAYVSNTTGKYVSVGSELYTVVTGDSLWRIAQNKLGNGTRYPEIKALNGMTSNTIYTGQKLLIP